MCIERCREIYPEAKYKLITTLKDFPIDGFEFINAYEYEREMFNQGYPVAIKEYMIYSDFARFDYLRKHENHLYLDIDMWCASKAPLAEKAASAGIEAIWSGRQTDVVNRAFMERGSRRLLIGLTAPLHKAGALDISKYFEHKPKWSKPYRLEVYAKS